MAIEIIPKDRIKAPSWAVILFIIFVIILLGLGGSYFYLYQTSNKISDDIKTKEEAIKKTSDEAKLEANILSKERKINNFSSLISTHRKYSNIFDFLEKTTHPQISFIEFNFSSDKDLINLKGEAGSFIVLGQQLLILKKEQILKKVILSEVGLSQEGKIRFSLQLTFDPQVFK